jgi:hypothetical protein
MIIGWVIIITILIREMDRMNNSSREGTTPTIVIVMV